MEFHSLYIPAKQYKISMANPYFSNGDIQLKVEMKHIEHLKEPNKSYALEFKGWMERQNKAKRTIARRLGELTFILNHFDSKDAKKVSKKDIQGLIEAIDTAKRRDGKEIAKISKGKIKMTLRKFYKFLFNSKGYPELVEDIKPDRAKNTLLPSDMLLEADIEKLLLECKNPRDKAIISLLWSGLRCGELLALRLQDVKVESDGASVIVAGKTGQRTVFLMNSTYLLDYIHNMRRKARSEAPLFVRLQNGTATEGWLTYGSLKKMLYDVRARVPELKNHRINSHLFRHSFASFLQAQNFNQEIMKKYFGWSSNEMASIYTHLNDQAVKDAIAKLGKREVKIAEPRLISKICWRCKFDNEPDRKYCRRCTADLVNPITQYTTKEGIDERMQRLENAIELLYQHLDLKTKKEIDEIKL